MSQIVQIRRRGTLTLPIYLRRKYNIENGNTFRLVDLDGVIVLVPKVPLVPEIANEIEKIRLEAGLSAEELLQSLGEQRTRYNREKYNKSSS